MDERIDEKIGLVKRIFGSVDFKNGTEERQQEIYKQVAATRELPVDMVV
jgi:hypothetical protein